MFKIVNGQTVEMTASDIAQRNKDEADWIAGQEARDIASNLAAYKYDPEIPSLEEKVDAILEGGAKLDEVKTKIAAVKTKHGVN